jgi:hypothetical protein
MIIKKKKTFEPLTITLETETEYLAFVEIIDEAGGVLTDERKFMNSNAGDLAIELSNYFSNNG